MSRDETYLSRETEAASVIVQSFPRRVMCSRGASRGTGGIGAQWRIQKAVHDECAARRDAYGGGNVAMVGRVGGRWFRARRCAVRLVTCSAHPN